MYFLPIKTSSQYDRQSQQQPTAVLLVPFVPNLCILSGQPKLHPSYHILLRRLISLVPLIFIIIQLFTIHSTSRRCYTGCTGFQFGIW